MWTREHELEERLRDIRVTIERGRAAGESPDRLLELVVAETTGALQWVGEEAA